MWHQERRNRLEESRGNTHPGLGKSCCNQKRANEDCERKPKRQRRSGADVTEYLREKSEKELKIREEELALKAKEIENEKKKQAQMFQSQEDVQTIRLDANTSDSFFAATNTIYGIIRKISQKVM